MSRYEDDEELEDDFEEAEEEFEDRWESTPQYWKDRWEHYYVLGMDDRLGPKGTEYIRELYGQQYEHEEEPYDDYDEYDFDFEGGS